ncbi:hypothetical protein RI367_008756 [Sorochytrium milnesiophthora]
MADAAKLSKKRNRSAIDENDIADESDEEISNQPDPLTVAETERRNRHICDFTHCLPPTARGTVERMVYPNTAHYDVKQMASLDLLQKSATIYTVTDKAEKAVDGLHLANNFWLFQLGAQLCGTLRKALRVYDLVMHISYEVVYTSTVPSTCNENFSEEALRQVLAWNNQHYCPRNICLPTKAIRWETDVLLGCEESEDGCNDFTNVDDSLEGRDKHHSKYINSVSEDVLDYAILGRPDRYAVQGPMWPPCELPSEIISIEND